MLYFLCFIAPLAILFCGFKQVTLIVNIILTLCGYVPGVIHAFFVVSSIKADKRTKKITKEIIKQKNKIAENLTEQ